MKCDVCGRTDDEYPIEHVYGHNLCNRHKMRYWRHGLLDNTRTIYDKNEIVINGDISYIVLYDKSGKKVGEATIDTEDVELCKQYKWHMRKSRNTYYAATTVNGGNKIFLHRLVLSYSGCDDVDHVDRNGLNNVKSNLRVVSRSKNIVNQDSRGYTETPSGRYAARVMRNYKQIYIGTYDTPEEAISAREQYIQANEI